MEVIPDVLKLGVVSPIYKGNGKDPLDANSYRGITLTPVLSKVLELLLVNRLVFTLMEQGIPHLNQTGFIKKVSCSEAIFSTLEVLSQYAQKGDTMYMCLYDLQKAFDTVQYPVLLKRVFDAGINGKAWRLIRSWYNSPKSMVKVGGRLSSSPFSLERGVLQGSILSPMLFLLVMDPLLRELESNSLGPYVSGLYSGAFAHADDIRTISSSLSTLNRQISFVQQFAIDNALALNASKCEVLVISPKKVPPTPICSIADQQLVPKDSAKCLGHWWSWDLSADKAVDEAIKKARRAFFSFGAMGAFQGKLNPLSSRAIFETCVIPILLYGCENWFLPEPLLQRLEAFQGEIGRRILHLSRYHSTLATRIALDWPSVTARILIRKIGLLHKICSSQDSIGHQFFLSITASSSQPLQLIQTCHSLESKLNCSGLTNKVVSSDLSDFGSLRGIKEHILKQDHLKTLAEASSHRSTSLAAKVASEVNWLKLWDLALDHGIQGTSALQALYRTLTTPSFGPSSCPHCTENFALPYFDHFISSHSALPNSDLVLNLLCSESPDIFIHAKCFLISHSYSNCTLSFILLFSHSGVLLVFELFELVRSMASTSWVENRQFHGQKGKH